MPNVNIARRIDVSDKVTEFKRVMDLHLKMLDFLLGEFKTEVEPKFLHEFVSLVKVCKIKIFQHSEISNEVAKEVSDELNSISKHVWEWDKLSDKQKSAILTELTNFDELLKSIPEFALLNNLLYLFDELHSEVKIIRTKLTYLSDEFMWKKLLAYANQFEIQESEGKNEKFKQELRKFGNIILKNISISVVEISELLESLPNKISMFRSFLGEEHALDHNTLPARRINDLKSVEQRLLDLHEGFTNDLKKLPLFSR